MADLKTPGVYLDKISTGSAPIDGVSTSVVAFMGKAPRGDVNTGFVMISSWSDFVRKASFGADESVFRNDDYMAYNIYNFYQNGGGKAYFGVIKPSGAKVASTAVGNIRFTAKSAGIWANGIKVVISPNTFDNTKFDVRVFRSHLEGTTVVDDLIEHYTALSNNVGASDYFDTVLNSSDIFKVSPEPDKDSYTISTSNGLLTGGDEGKWTDSTAEDAALVGAEGLIHKLLS